jgi:hypothetical protein
MRMETYDFLVDDPSEEVVIASLEADSPKEAFARLQPLYEPYSLLWLPDYQEEPLRETGRPDGTGSRRDEVSRVPRGAGGD